MIRTSLLCIAVALAGTAPAAAQTRGSDRTGFQDTTYQVIARLNGLCMDVDGALREGASLVMRDCNGRNSQLFHAQRVNDRAMRLVAGGRRGDLCLDASMERGQSLRLARCDAGSVGQQWIFEARDARPLRARIGMCANIEGAREEAGARVISWPCVGAINEGWTFNPVV
jgi:hypothetical protein